MCALAVIVPSLFIGIWIVFPNSSLVIIYYYDNRAPPVEE